ncbi:dTMP kinase [Saccharicrinis fermentans]|uniref:Thymidylate kinase n=1 Tax=Saccharicrinis fermentans DSM 9555 = JCM 21142 TaxID=869213 RepID=W7YLL4_9BACT|nr:deoxynucleoside kinase [Saccharicrinis fermentans]GAF05486.1 thymidylate kinase [Saccharicrinis fermentans DSM 9555 = JCM 21142]
MNYHIVFEGIDGSGKSSLINMVSEFLGDRNVKIINWFKNQKIRDIANVYNLSGKMTPDILLAIHASHTLSLLNEIKDHTDYIFLWDRYIYSSYASVVARGGETELASEVVRHFPKPNLVIYIKNQPEISYNRVLNRGEITFYEAGLDIIYRGSNLIQKFTDFKQGKINNTLIKLSFMTLMEEINRNLESILSSINVVHKITDFEINNSSQIKDVKKKIESIIS